MNTADGQKTCQNFDSCQKFFVKKIFTAEWLKKKKLLSKLLIDIISICCSCSNYI